MRVFCRAREHEARPRPARSQPATPRVQQHAIDSRGRHARQLRDDFAIVCRVVLAVVVVGAARHAEGGAPRVGVRCAADDACQHADASTRRPPHPALPAAEDMNMPALPACCSSRRTPSRSACTHARRVGTSARCEPIWLAQRCPVRLRPPASAHLHHERQVHHVRLGVSAGQRRMEMRRRACVAGRRDSMPFEHTPAPRLDSAHMQRCRQAVTVL